MVFRFLKNKKSPILTSWAVPPDNRLYAIGDIHGRLDLLEQLLAMIDRDDAGRLPMETTLVFLGDLVDRGPNSAGVVECLRLLAHAKPGTRFLSGNHEEVFLRAVNDPGLEALKFFCRIGGRETILSYGISEANYNAMDYEELKATLTARVPQSHVTFLESFEDKIEIGDYLFVHAGIRPGVALDDQRPRDLRWIREPFLDYATQHERMIVHGHTITADIDEHSNRIGIDTGAYASGRLTALGMEGTSRWVLQTGNSSI